MRFDHAETVPHPLDRVFAAQRDALVEAVRSLEEVERVELRSESRRADGAVEQVHVWTGSPKVLPALVRPMVPAHLLQWRQRTLWDPAHHTGTWVIDVPGLGEAVDARGVNRYAAVPGGTRCTVEGDFSFRPDRLAELRTVPPAAVPLVERVVVSLVVPLVGKTAAAVSRYLDAARDR